MTRVSRFPLKEKVYNEIIETLWEVVTDLDREEDVERFFSVFLSKAEKIMLAKRLAIAVMLEAGIDYLEISEKLKVSTGTIRDVSYKLSDEGFRKIVGEFTERFKSRKKEMSWLEAALGAKTNVKARARLFGG